MNDGDWICLDPICGNINFARRVSCYRCNKERDETPPPCKKKLGTEIGKTAAEKSRGLFNADDWQCNKCANVNWARRQTCNVCNAPKYGEVEARTGYGGGYNERGVVEYRRREPSSDDEYDEFGRKKRKRKADSEENERPEKVGITEGAVFKNLPPKVLQKETNKEHNMPVFGPNLLMNTSNTNMNKNGSLSDSSVCELPSLTEAAVSRHHQISKPRQEYMLPTYKKNGAQSRKRYISTSDRDQSRSSGYEANSKKSKRETTDSSITMCNPVMENSVSSTKTEMVFPAENFQVTYTLEERVKCAAFAVAYNNCKITADKFQSLYDKPAPDFQTIFAWRQRLMSTGCLDDSHLETAKPFQTKSAINTDNTNTKETKIVCKLPNPEEIIIPSESEEEESSKNLEKSERSMSIETLFIGGHTELQAAGSSASTVDGRGSRARSCSQSTHLLSRSNSRDSQDSHYPDTDSEKGSKSVNSKEVLKSTSVSARQSVHGSDSESVSFNSGEDNFLSRIFGEGRKRRKVKKRTIPAAVPKLSDYASNDVNTFEGYNTVKKSDQSPLVTGNIYTNNLRNMNTRTRQNIDIDGCSSEYVPTKIGSTAKKNYQEFKDNVRKKGYWAKGNGSSLTINRHNMSMDVIHKTKGIPSHTVEEPVKSVGTHQYDSVQTKPIKNQANDFTSKNITSTKSYLPFDKPIQTVKNISVKDKASENTDRIFAQVQSNNVSRNRSILDIFDISDPAQKSPERKNDLDKYAITRKTYEWDEDDEALYKNSDCEEEQAAPRGALSPTASNRNQSPTSDMLYTAEKDSQSQDTCENKSVPDFIKDKHILILDMLKDFQNKEISQMVSPLKHPPQLQPAEDINGYQKSTADTIPNIAITGFEPIPNLPAHRPEPMPNLLMTRPDPILNPPMVRSDRVTNPTMDRFDSGPKHTVKRTDTIPKYPMDRQARVSKSINRSDLISNHNKNRPDPIPNLHMPGISPIPKQSMTSPDRVSNLRMNRSDLTPNLMTRPDPNPNLSRPNQGLNHTISRSELTQNHTSNRPEPISNLLMIRTDRVPNHAMTRSDLNSNLTMNIPDPIPIELSNEVLRLSEENVDCESTQNASKTISPSKRVHILENITIQPPSPHQNITPSYQQNTIQNSSPKAAQTNHTNFVSSSPKVDEKQDTLEKPPEKEQPVSHIDYLDLLDDANAINLRLALQNLQQIAQSSSPKHTEEMNSDHQSQEEQCHVAETINLTNDEEWEKESNRDGSIERQLEQMDGSTDNTPFLSDALDPGPVVIPLNVVRKLNLNMPNLEGQFHDTNSNENSNENAPVIGNFKSFALPKPILLNRLKLTVKTAEKPTKSSGKRVKRRNKSKPAPAPGEPAAEEDDDEDSDEEADLSKYDLWGSDAEQENTEKTKDGEGSKDGGSDIQEAKNDKVSPNNNSKRRSRSSSSSSSSTSSSSSSHSSTAPQNKFDDFDLNSERESPLPAKGRKSRSRSPRQRAPSRRKADNRSAAEARSHEPSREKEYSRERERRDRSRAARDERKERRYSRDGGAHYNSRGRHR